MTTAPDGIPLTIITTLSLPHTERLTTAVHAVDPTVTVIGLPADADFSRLADQTVCERRTLILAGPESPAARHLLADRRPGHISWLLAEEVPTDVVRLVLQWVRRDIRLLRRRIGGPLRTE